MKSKTMKCLKQLPVVAGLIFSSAVSAQTGIVNLVTTDGGLHRITYTQLQQQSVDLNGLNVADLALTHAGEAVARLVKDTNEDGFFNQGDYIDFIAENIDNRYTNEAVYTLHLDSDLALLIEQSAANTETNQRVSRLGKTQAVKADNLRYNITSANLNDPWNIDYIFANGGPVTKSYSIDLPKLSSQNNGVNVVVELTGASSLKESPDHSVMIKFNGVPIAARQFDGVVFETFTARLRPGMAKESNNTFEVVLPMDHEAPVDVVTLESVRIDYEIDLTAVDNDIVFSSSDSTFSIAGLTTDDVSLYQKAEDGTVKLLQPLTISKDDGSYELNVYTEASNAEYFVYDADGAPTPQLRNLADTQSITSGEAEYLILTHGDFIGSELDRLVQLRQADYSVKVVDVEQVYAQFGRHTAEDTPIHDYIRYAADQLGTKMVVLIGGDTNDYRGFKSESVSHIPTTYRVINGGSAVITHAPSDAAYGDLDGDDIPDIPVGRFPVRTNQELSTMLNKIEQFDQRTYSQQAVFAADKTDNGNGYSFVPDAEDIVASLPASMQTGLSAAWQDTAGTHFDNKKAYIETDGNDLAKSKLLASMNEGAELTAYLGHSNMFKWSDDLFSTQDAQALTNINKPTVMTQYGCWNTYYVLPEGNSLAQVLLLSGDQGAATVLGSSTLTLASSEARLGEFLYQEMYVPGKTLGDALVAAKKSISGGSASVDVVLGWQIMGDPAIVMNPAN